MSLLDTILNAQGGGAVEQLSSRFGLGPEQTASALAALVPALAAGVHQNVQSEGGLASLLSAVSNGQHQRYVDDPSALGHEATIADGNAILGHVFGSKDVSRQVADHAASQTGIGADVLKKMMPMAAALVMGALARQTSSSASLAPGAHAGMLGGGAQPDLMGILAATLGQGSGGAGVASSVVGMLGRFLGR